MFMAMREKWARSGIMAKRSIADVNVAGKTVLMRVDFNVPLDDNCNVTDDRRVRMAIPSIKSVIDRGGKVILCSHLGRPEPGQDNSKESLKPAADVLATLLGKPVAFATDAVDADASAKVAALKNGDVLVLENLRFYKGEKKGDAAFAAKLAEFADIYCNDAFGTCHRPDASIVAVAEQFDIKKRAAGFLVNKEIDFLEGAFKYPQTPVTAVFGGSKVSDKIAILQKFTTLANNMIIGGAMAYTFLKYLGREVGKSRVEADKMLVVENIFKAAEARNVKIILPEDHICAANFAEDSPPIYVNSPDIPADLMGLDIGPKTAARYASIIESSKVAIWNGPMGVFEWEKFAVYNFVIRCCFEQTQGEVRHAFFFSAQR